MLREVPGQEATIRGRDRLGGGSGGGIGGSGRVGGSGSVRVLVGDLVDDLCARGVRALEVGLGLEEVFVFDSKSQNRDRAVEAVESLSEAGPY